MWGRERKRERGKEGSVGRKGERKGGNDRGRKRERVKK